MNIHGNGIKLIAANSNPALAKKIADELGVPLAKCEVKKFSDGEISVTIGESVRGCDVFVIQSTCTPVNDNLMELLIVIDALKRASAGRITAVIPYFGYARQDRKSKRRGLSPHPLASSTGFILRRWQRCEPESEPCR